MDIGIDIKPPKTTCGDKNCPFHGTLKVRGQIIEGKVISDKMHNTAVVNKDNYRFIPKFERYEKRKAHYLVHNPTCIGAKVGDLVKIMECRPISKLKSFVIIEKTGA
jgi:small subunit ribosomal protein S17